MRISFTVFGRAAPAGSKRGFPITRHDGSTGVVLTDACRNTKAWQAMVADAAMQAYEGLPLRTPISLQATFVRSRPKSHFGTGRNSHLLKDSAPSYPTARPDLTKLVRAIEDACTGILWADDAQIVHQQFTKAYGDRDACIIHVEEAP